MAGEPMSVLTDIEDSEGPSTDEVLEEIWKNLNEGKKEFTVTINPSHLDEVDIEDYLMKAFSDTEAYITTECTIEGNQAHIKVDWQED